MSVDPISHLLDLCEEELTVLRSAAAYALGETGLQSPQVIEQLVLMTNDQYTDVRVAATKALGRLCRQETSVAEPEFL